MKLLLSALALTLSLSAHAADTLSFEADASFAKSADGYQLVLNGPAADQLYDRLAVAAVPAYEDVLIHSKQAGGIYCYSENSTPRFSSCIVQFDAKEGVKGAQNEEFLEDAFTVEVVGKAAKGLYNALSAQSYNMDGEGYYFWKQADGVKAYNHTGEGSYYFTMTVKPGVGVVR